MLVLKSPGEPKNRELPNVVPCKAKSCVAFLLIAYYSSVAKSPTFPLVIVAVWYATAYIQAQWCGAARYGTVRYGMLWYGMVLRYGTVRKAKML